MKLTTSKGNEYQVDWIDGPTFTTGEVLLQMMDDRRLPEIAAEFDGLEWLKRESENQGNKSWEGYSVLQMITKLDDGNVRIVLSKG